MTSWELKDKFKYLTFERACMDLRRLNLRIERLVQKLFWKGQKAIVQEKLRPELKRYSSVRHDIHGIFCWCRPLYRMITECADQLQEEYECSVNLADDFVERLQALHTLLQADFRRQRLAFKARLVCEPLEFAAKCSEGALRNLEIKAKLDSALEEEKSVIEKQTRIYHELKQHMGF